MTRVVEDDPMFQLLTDALRAGPGSPAWREAVGALKERGAEGDEYSLLLAARERIESGKEWRSVRAGAGFTRKVMEGIEGVATARTAKGFPAAGIIGGIAGLVLLGLVGVGVYVASSSKEGAGEGESGAVAADLSGVYFTRPVATAVFDDLTPTGWHEVGSLPLGGASSGLVPTTAPAAGGIVGGAVVCDTPARAPVAFEVQLRVEKLSDELIPQVFVTDEPTFSESRGTSSRELVWMAGADGMRVLTPDGRVGASGKVRATREAQVVRVVLGKSGGFVELDGKRVWAGEHQLRGDRAWYVGVRFLAKGGAGVRGATFVSARVLKPAGG